MSFTPDYRHFADVITNRRPARLPIYEHIVSPNVMELVLDEKFADLINGDRRDLGEFFRHFLCANGPDEIFREVLGAGRRYRASARGNALGTGNSIPDYVPVENYVAMIEATKAQRAEEAE